MVVGSHIHFNHIGAEVVAVDDHWRFVAVYQPLHRLGHHVGPHFFGVLDFDFQHLAEHASGCIDLFSGHFQAAFKFNAV